MKFVIVCCLIVITGTLLYYTKLDKRKDKLTESQLALIVRDSGNEIMTALGYRDTSSSGKLKIDQCFDGLGQPDNRRMVVFNDNKSDKAVGVSNTAIDALVEKLGINFSTDRRIDSIIYPSTRRVDFGIDRKGVRLSGSIYLSADGKLNVKMESFCENVGDRKAELGVWTK